MADYHAHNNHRTYKKGVHYIRPTDFVLQRKYSELNFHIFQLLEFKLCEANFPALPVDMALRVFTLAAVTAVAIAQQETLTITVNFGNPVGIEQDLPVTASIANVSSGTTTLRLSNAGANSLVATTQDVVFSGNTVTIDQVMSTITPNGAVISDAAICTFADATGVAACTLIETTLAPVFLSLLL